MLNLSVFAQTTHTWTGATDSDWGNASNWNSSQVPAAGDHVIISNAAFSPLLNANREVGDLTIDSGAVLNLESYNLTIHGDWVNEGTLISGFSTVIFSGTTSQSISGNQTFYNLKIENEGGVNNISGSDSIVNVLSILYGNFYTHDSIVFISNVNGTASLDELGGSITGKVTVQRYINVTSDDWRFLSSPISNFSFVQVADDFWTSGIIGSTYPSEPFISLYYYDETDSGTSDIGYAWPASVSESFPTGAGFMAYMGTSSIADVVDYYGNLNTGSVSLPVTYTLTDTVSDGWNLVGNPYASALDWNDTTITRVNMDNAFYIWNAESGVYASYVDGIGSNGGTNVIASGQSFYVRSNDVNPVLTVTESSKTTGTDPFLKTTSGTSYFSMKIENSAGTDEAVIRPRAGATENFDAEFDAHKMFSSNWNIPSVYSTDSHDNYYSINQFDPGQIEIPIYVNTGISEMHEITFDGVESFDNLTCVLLEDLHTGVIYDLRTVNSISVFVSDTTWWPRFILRTGAWMEIQAADATCYNEDDGEINLAQQSDELFSLNVYNQFGGLVSSETALYQIASVSNLNPGMYVTEFTNQTCGLLLDTVFIEEPEWIQASFTASADTVFIPAESGEISFTNASLNADYYTWDFGDAVTCSLVNPTHTFSTPGSYSVKLTAHQSATCYNEFELPVEVISNLSLDETIAQQPEISLTGNQLQITSKSGGFVEVYSISGQLLFSQQMTSDQMVFELEKMAAQYLVVSVTYNGMRYSEKILNTSL